MCFEREYHIWECDLREGREAVYSSCKDCGLEKWWDPPKREKKGNQQIVRDQQFNRLDSPSTPSLPGIKRKLGLEDMNLLLDSLSYARCGHWRSLHSIAHQLNDAAWFAHEAARRFDALGHIEIAIGRRNVRPGRWAIAPTTIVVPEMGIRFWQASVRRPL